MADRTVSVKLKGNVNDYTSAVERAARETDKLADKADKFSRKRYTATLRADTSEAERRLAGLNSDLSRFANRKLSPAVELKAAQAQMDARRLGAELARLGSLKASPEVDADIALASAKLAVIREQIAKVGASDPVVNVRVNSDPASRRLGLLTSSIMAIGPAGLAAGTIAAGGLGAMASMTSVVAVGLGSVMLATQGMGDAVKAMNAYALEPTAENAKKVAEATRGMDESAVDFAKTVSSRVMPAIDRLKRAAQRGLFPGAEGGLNEMLKNLPAVERMIESTAGAMGQLAEEAGTALGSPEWAEFFRMIETSGGPILVNLGRSVGNVIGMFRGLAVAFAPLAEDMARGLEKITGGWNEWAANLSKSKGFQDFIAYVRENGPVLIDLIGQVGRLIGNIATAAMPVGAVLLPILRDLVSILADIAGSPAAPAILGIVSALGMMNLGLKGIAGVRNSALGTLLGLATNSRNAAGGVTALGNAASGTAGKTSRAAGAMNVLKGAAGGLATGVALGLAGMAVYQGQIDDVSQALLSGGQAAEDAKNKFMEQGKQIGGIGVPLYNYKNGLAEAEQKARDLYNAMTPLQKAGVDVTRAQNDLNLAIGRFGPGSSQAIAAHRALGTAQANQAVQTQLANRVGADYGRTLGNLAAQAGPVGAAAQRIAAGMRATELSAIGARFGVDQAGRAIAILPGGKTVVINADANSAKFQIQQVAGNLAGLPLNKAIRVDALTVEAQNRLRGIGLEVTQLKDGSFKVVAHTEESRKAVHDLGILAEGDRFFDVGARTAQGTISVQDLQRLASTPQTLPLGANTSIAQNDIRDTQSLAVQRQTFPHLANTSGAAGAVASVHNAARVPQSFTTNANVSNAESAISRLKRWASNAVSFVVNAVTGRAEGGPVGYADGGPIQRAASGMPVRSTRTLSTGRLTGPGSGTSDSIPLRAASGEWVINARTSRQQGAGMMTMLNAGLADIVPKVNNASLPQRIPTAPRCNHSGMAETITRDIINNITVHNPIAERTSDDVQRTMRKMANQGMFADG